MITLRYGTNVVVLEKGQYELRDFKTPTGDSGLKEISADGSTRLVEKRRKMFGDIDKLALRLIVSYADRKSLYAMAFGSNRATLSNPIEVIISEEGELNGVKKIRYSGNDTFFDDKEVVTSMTGSGSDVDRWYQIDMLFYIL